MSETTPDMPAPTPDGRVSEVFGAFLKLGLTSFGGPIAHLGYFRRELVERRGWLSEGQFGQLLAISQFLPGPASSQLGFCLGLLRAGWGGAIAAFLAFTLPSALLLVGFASLLPLLSGPLAQAAIQGLKIVAFAVVAEAVLGMAKKLCPDAPRGTIAILAAGALLLTAHPAGQLVVVAGGAIAGVLWCRVPVLGDNEPLPWTPSPRVGFSLLAVFAGLLFGLPLLAATQGGLGALAEAFYRAGALVFGGGHVVLPLLEDSVVGTGWVERESFLAGYGAAQAIPGPLFAFSAYLGALIPTGYHAAVGAAIALVFMFLPGFLLVAGVLPLWRAVSGHRVASNALAGVNAAVVGLLGAALYDPIFTAAIQRPTDLAIGLVAFALLHLWRLSPLAAVAWCVLASMALTLI